MYVANEKVLSYVLSVRLYNLILAPLYDLTHTHIHTYNLHSVKTLNQKDKCMKSHN